MTKTTRGTETLLSRCRGFWDSTVNCLKNQIIWFKFNWYKWQLSLTNWGQMNGKHMKVEWRVILHQNLPSEGGSVDGIHVISLSSNELWTGDSSLRLSSRPNPARYVVSRKVYVNDWTFEKRTPTRLWEFTLTLRTRSRFFVPHLHKLFAVSVRTLNIRKTMRNTLSLKCDHNKANHCGEKSLWELHIVQSLSEQIRAFFSKCFKISCWWQILCSSSKREFWKLERLLSLIRVNSGFNKFSLRLSRFLLKANPY